MSRCLRSAQLAGGLFRVGRAVTLSLSITAAWDTDARGEKGACKVMSLSSQSTLERHEIIAQEGSEGPKADPPLPQLGLHQRSGPSEPCLSYNMVRAQRLDVDGWRPNLPEAQVPGHCSLGAQLGGSSFYSREFSARDGSLEQRAVASTSIDCFLRV